MVKNIIIIIGLFFSAAIAQDVKVTVKTDTSSYLIGDKINLVFEIIHPQATKIIFPDIQDSIKPLEQLYADTPRTYSRPDGLVRDVYLFHVAAYDSIKKYSKSFNIPYSIPGDSIARLAQSNVLELSITRVTVDTTIEIRDLKGPLTEEDNRPFYKKYWWVLLILFLLLITAGAFIYLKYFRKEKPVIEYKVQLTPEQLALQRLKLLEQKQLWQNGEFKEYHSEITEIIREFFENRFSFNALKLTTNETVEELRKRSKSSTIAQMTEEFLSLADMVKFAKHIPPFETNERMINLASQIITSSTPVTRQEGASR